MGPRLRPGAAWSLQVEAGEPQAVRVLSRARLLDCASGWLLACLCPDVFSSPFHGRLGALFLSIQQRETENLFKEAGKPAWDCHILLAASRPGFLGAGASLRLT